MKYIIAASCVAMTAVAIAYAYTAQYWQSLIYCGVTIILCLYGQSLVARDRDRARLERLSREYEWRKKYGSDQ